MPIGKPKEPKAPKAPKEKKPKKPKKEKPPKGKKLKKGQEAPEEVEGQEGEGQQPKKKKFPILLLIPVVLAVAAAVFFFFIRPRMSADSDPDVSASVSPEPQPPVLPTQIVLDEGLSIVGMALDSDESDALAERTKTVTYTYTNLNNAGKAAETYASQLASKESPAFTLVDEDFVRIREAADYTTAEGMVLLARNVPVSAPAATPTPAPEVTVSLDPEASPAPTPTPTPEPEPTPEPVTYVHTVRITWSPGVCVVTASEEEGKVTSSPNSGSPAQSISLWDAQDRLESMDPAQLGLTGTSMDEYEIIPMDGTQLVDGKACICMYVYGSNNAAHSNEYMGSYLMSLDGQHLYRLDPVTNQVVELEYSPK